MERAENPQKSPEKEPHYNFPEIAEMEPAMIFLVEKLKDKIESCEYDALISDDIGGRIPTLVLKEVFGDKGKSEIKTFFLPGGQGNWSLDTAELEAFLVKDIVPVVKKRALLITEFIQTGHSIKEFTKIFDKTGLKNFDVASAVVTRPAEEYQHHKIFWGEVGTAPSLYKVRSTVGGTRKVVGGGRMYKIKNDVGTVGEKLSIQSNINKAREDAHTMAQRILEKVW